MTTRAFSGRARTGIFVGFLTHGGRGRRKTDDSRRRAPHPVAAAAAVMVLAAPAAAVHAAGPADRQPVEDIARAAERFLAERTGRADERLTLEASALDPRLDLARCDRPLEGFLRRGTEIRSRTVVGVRCSGRSPWKVYVPVDVIVNDTVLVAARTLPGGSEPAAGDVRVEKRDVSRLTGGYFSQPDQLAGQRLKNSVQAGRIITPAMLEADRVIRRGQTVTLLVRDQTVNIRMSGRALMDGALNQRIRVENSTSKRVVEGIVRSPEHVEILVY